MSSPLSRQPDLEACAAVQKARDSCPNAFAIDVCDGRRQRVPPAVDCVAPQNSLDCLDDLNEFPIPLTPIRDTAKLCGSSLDASPSHLVALPPSLKPLPLPDDEPCRLEVANCTALLLGGSSWHIRRRRRSCRHRQRPCAAGTNRPAGAAVTAATAATAASPCLPRLVNG